MSDAKSFTGAMILTFPVMAAGASVASGLAVIAHSLLRGVRSDAHYGRWDRWVI